MPRKATLGCKCHSISGAISNTDFVSGTTCKERHLKCDEILPTCTPCSKSHKLCSYAARAPEDRHHQDTRDPALQRSNPEIRRAMILRDWADSTAELIDVSDQSRCFAYVATGLALKHRALYGSIRALTVLHRFMLGLPETEEEARICYESAIRDLSQTISMNAAPDIILACTVILRVYQEMSRDFEVLEDLHLSGALSLLKINAVKHPELRNTSFWAVLRQSISESLKTSMRLRGDLLGLLDSGIYLPVDNAYFSELDWVNAMTGLLARIIDRLHDPMMGFHNWAGFKSALQRWYSGLPSSFLCLYDDPTDYHGYLAYTHHWHTLALGSYHYAMAITASNDVNGFRNFHLLRMTRAARFESHRGVRVHLLGMLASAARLIDPEHEAFVMETSQLLVKQAGFPIKTN